MTDPILHPSGSPRLGEAPGPRAVTAVELRDQIHAEQAGVPFLVYRDGAGTQRIFTPDDATSLWVGRSGGSDVPLEWDPEVSGLHAQLERAGDTWTLIDDGLSRNGSYVNGERVSGRRALRDGDMLRFGRTVLLYRCPGAQTPATMASIGALTATSLSEAQRRVLVALCRPFKHGAAFATAPTNQQIADELYLSVEAIKTHLRALFEKFEVDQLPQNSKRLALVQRALQSGLITERDL